MQAVSRKLTQDEEHLKLLAIFHYVVAGLAAVFALFPVFHLIFGLAFILAPEKFGGPGQAPPAFLGWMFVIFAVVFIAMGWTLAGLILAAGRSLAKQRRYLFCIVMAAIECVFFPFGTALGAFTIAVLMRESVKGLFGAQVGHNGQ